MLVALLAVGVAFASTQYNANSWDITAEAAGFDTDTLGGQDVDTDTLAYIYARFFIAGMAFKVTGPDVWVCSALVPAENAVTTQATDLEIENIGGVSLDLAFGITDEDLITTEDWQQETGDWTAPTTPNWYTLGLVVGDTDYGTEYTTTDFGVEDILTVGSLEWYASGGKFAPANGVYANEGTNSLNLWAGPDAEDNVDIYYRVLMSEGGSTSVSVHIVQVQVAGRISIDT